MSKRHSPANEAINDENLCPISRKRSICQSSRSSPLSSSPACKTVKTLNGMPLPSPFMSELEELGLSVLSDGDSSKNDTDLSFGVSAEVSANTTNDNINEQQPFKRPEELKFGGNSSNKSEKQLLSDGRCMANAFNILSVNKIPLVANNSILLNSNTTATSSHRNNGNQEIPPAIKEVSHSPDPPNYLQNMNKLYMIEVGDNSFSGLMLSHDHQVVGVQTLTSLKTQPSRSPLKTVTHHNFIRKKSILQSNVQHWSQMQWEDFGEEKLYSNTPEVVVKSNEMEEHHHHQFLHRSHSYKETETIVLGKEPSEITTNGQELPINNNPSSSSSSSALPPPPPPNQQTGAMDSDLTLAVEQSVSDRSSSSTTAAAGNKFFWDKMNNEQYEFFLYRPIQRKSSSGDGKNYFNLLSDEMILQIFKWLPKKSLLRCGYVCRRFNRCASDESLWTRLDLGNRFLKSGALENVLKRGVVILRLAQAEITGEIFETQSSLTLSSSSEGGGMLLPSTSTMALLPSTSAMALLQEAAADAESAFACKLQYLDLSMCGISKTSLRTLLSCCRNLKKLSLEHLMLNDEICEELSKNVNLTTLNLAMCSGLEAWSVCKMMGSLQQLSSLNISWTKLSIDAITTLVTHITPNLLRLNIAGCRKTLFDSHLATLVKRCPQLLELDVSDCTGLTGIAIPVICKFKMLEYLSMSRCYLIPARAYIELRGMPSLMYLDIFGMLTDTAMQMLQQTFTKININKFLHSSVARPTVGTRRTSIWGLRTRD